MRTAGGKYQEFTVGNAGRDTADMFGVWRGQSRTYVLRLEEPTKKNRFWAAVLECICQVSTLSRASTLLVSVALMSVSPAAWIFLACRPLGPCSASN